MELKHIYPLFDDFDDMLLIVPYGIETHGQDCWWKVRQLLIVPYGIETQQQWRPGQRETKLLIVPYGIETCVRVENNSELLNF